MLSVNPELGNQFQYLQIYTGLTSLNDIEDIWFLPFLFQVNSPIQSPEGMN